MSKKKIRTIIIIAVILAAICGALAVFLIMSNGNDKLAKHLSLGQKYLTEMNYEDAIAEFDKALEIDPLCTDAYIGKADACLGLKDYLNARKTIEEGISVICSEMGFTWLGVNEGLATGIVSVPNMMSGIAASSEGTVSSKDFEIYNASGDVIMGVTVPDETKRYSDKEIELIHGIVELENKLSGIINEMVEVGILESNIPGDVASGETSSSEGGYVVTQEGIQIPEGAIVIDGDFMDFKPLVDAISVDGKRFDQWEFEDFVATYGLKTYDGVLYSSEEIIPEWETYKTGNIQGDTYDMAWYSQEININIDKYASGMGVMCHAWFPAGGSGSNPLCAYFAQNNINDAASMLRALGLSDEGVGNVMASATSYEHPAVIQTMQGPAEVYVMDGYLTIQCSPVMIIYSAIDGNNNFSIQCSGGSNLYW